MAFWSRRIFVKNSLSSDGGLDRVGDGVGLTGVCACIVGPVANTIAHRIMPKRHCELLFLRMLFPLLFDRLVTDHQHRKRSRFHAALGPAPGCYPSTLGALFELYGTL